MRHPLLFRCIRSAIIAMISLWLCACTTMALYQKKPLSDTIQTITTTSDNNYIVLTGQQYQYRLTNSPQLANGLFWTRKLGANPLLFLDKLEVNHDQTIRGYYHVRVDSHFSNPYKIFT